MYPHKNFLTHFFFSYYMTLKSLNQNWKKLTFIFLRKFTSTQRMVATHRHVTILIFLILSNLWLVVVRTRFIVVTFQNSPGIYRFVIKILLFKKYFFFLFFLKTKRSQKPKFMNRRVENSKEKPTGQILIACRIFE